MFSEFHATSQAYSGTRSRVVNVARSPRSTEFGESLASRSYQFRGSGSTRSNDPMRVEYELLRSAFIKSVVAARRILQGQHPDIHCLRDSHLVVQDGHHELPVETEHGT